ncbi:hypothetical protein, partial [Sphingomonas sp. AX6]|uniref:hypothetical protein n=1 Tax=Sphingomonas sp. AX6 TaxID=2653171 RepID=UPI001356D12F
PAPTPAPTPTPTQPAANCPSGYTDRGVLAGRRNCEISGRITTNTALANLPGVIYSLAGRVDVGTDVGGDGSAAGGQSVTLTVDPGVVVFASSGLDFLVVNRGSRINAEGTATNPIIFTSRANVTGTATDSSQGQWGGIVLLGRAPISDCLSGAVGGAANCQQQVEGATNALYGGAVANDNSGVFRYVQIRYSGFEIAPGNELQGLTLGGVGSGTTIDHVQVHNSSDDGIEIFGGRANLKNLIITGADDDGYDTDLGYKGFTQFVIGVQRAGGNSGDAMIEVDSNGNEDAQPRQNTRLANFTFVHRSTLAASVNAMLIRGGSDYSLINGVVTSPRICLDVDGAATVQAANAGLDEQGPPVVQSTVFSCTGGAFNDDGNVSVAAIQAFFNAGANNNANFTSTLTDVFVNGANERGVTPFNASTLSSFFVNTSYIGAVRDAQDTWYRGWSCDSSTASFGSNATCIALPTT